MDKHAILLRDARRQVEANAADAMTRMVSSFEAAQRAHDAGVRTDYLWMTDTTRDAAESCDLAWAAVQTRTESAEEQPGDIVHPAVAPDAVALAGAEQHYYHASTCLHCVDDGPEIAMSTQTTPSNRRDAARKLVREARRSLTTAKERLAAAAAPDGDVAALRRRIELREADAESFSRALGLSPGESAEPYHKLSKKRKLDNVIADPATARFEARAANNHAMALFGTGKLDDALDKMGSAVAVLFSDPVMRGVANAAGDGAGDAGASVPPRDDLQPALRGLWAQVDKARMALQNKQAGDRERLTCRKMMSTSCAWLFLRAHRPTDSLRDDIKQLVEGNRALVLASEPASEGVEAHGGAPLATLRRHLAENDDAWLRRRGYVLLLVALHAALEAVPTDNGQATSDLADRAINLAAKVGTTPSRFHHSAETTAGDWGAYAFRVAPENESKCEQQSPAFSALGRAWRFEKMAKKRKEDGRPTRHTGGAALCDADRDAINALLDAIQARAARVPRL